MTVMTPYRSGLSAGRDGFGQLLHAEWTKFRTVRGWIIGLVIGLIGWLASGCSPGRTAPASAQGGPARSGAAEPCPPAGGPAGEPVNDSFYFVHQPLTGDGTITVRVTSMTGLLRRRQPARRGTTRRTPARALPMGQGRHHHQGEPQSRVRVRGDDGRCRQRRAHAVELHRGHTRPVRRGQSGEPAVAAADPVRRRDHWLRIGGRHALDASGHRRTAGVADYCAGGPIRRRARVLGNLGLAWHLVSDRRPHARHRDL